MDSVERLQILRAVVRYVIVDGVRACFVKRYRLGTRRRVRNEDVDTAGDAVEIANNLLAAKLLFDAGLLARRGERGIRSKSLETCARGARKETEPVHRVSGSRPECIGLATHRTVKAKRHADRADS